MSKKKFMLRIDPRLMTAVEKWAGDEFRSVNGQIEWIIHRSLKESGRLKNQLDKDRGVGSDRPDSSESR
jgi:hypothetical protein